MTKKSNSSGHSNAKGGDLSSDPLMENRFTKGSSSKETLVVFNPEMVFDQIYQQHAPIVYRYLVLFLKNDAVAEDVFQEVFIKAYEQIKKNAGKRDIPRSWLIAVAKNAALDWQKKNVVRKELSQEPDQLFGVEDVTINFVEKIEQNEILEKVDQFLDNLSDREQSVFILRIVEEMKYKDIAKSLSISERNAKRVMKTALKKIVYLLKSEGIEKPNF